MKQMAEEKIILSEEPNGVKINVQDPNKPSKQIAQARKIPPKPSVGDKVIGAFFGQDVNSKNLGEHLLNDYAVPTAKKMANNAAQSTLKRIGDAVQVLLFGKVINSNTGPTDYTSFSQPNNVQPPTAHKLMNQVEQFAFSTRQDAMRVLDYLKGRIATYGSASVLDYYEAVNEPVDFMMANQGWIDLSAAEVRIAPEGFIIDLPRPIILKRG